MAGEDADTDKVVTPAGNDTDSACAIVAPEQTGPKIAETEFTLINLVTASTAATGSHALSARIIL
jgi:hypothetical protein